MESFIRCETPGCSRIVEPHSGQVVCDKHLTPPTRPSHLDEITNDGRGRIYVARLGPYVKIGYSRWVQKRLLDIPHEEILFVVRGAPWMEKAIHAHFEDDRVVLANGMREWFHVSDGLVEWIDNFVKTSRTCSIGDCSEYVKAKGLCEKHYRREMRIPNQLPPVVLDENGSIPF